MYNTVNNVHRQTKITRICQSVIASVFEDMKTTMKYAYVYEEKHKHKIIACLNGKFTVIQINIYKQWIPENYKYTAWICINVLTYNKIKKE